MNLSRTPRLTKKRSEHWFPPIPTLFQSCSHWRYRSWKTQLSCEYPNWPELPEIWSRVALGQGLLRSQVCIHAEILWWKVSGNRKDLFAFGRLNRNPPPKLFRVFKDVKELPPFDDPLKHEESAPVLIIDDYMWYLWINDSQPNGTERNHFEFSLKFLRLISLWNFILVSFSYAFLTSTLPFTHDVYSGHHSTNLMIHSLK